MKNTFLPIIFLISATSAFAENNIVDKISGWTYSDDTEFSRYTTALQCYEIGDNSYTGCDNFNWDSNDLSGGSTYDINLGQNARYELVFTVNITNSGSNFPLFNIYLAAPNNSISYGNYYDIGGSGHDARGAANAFLHSNVDISQGDWVEGSNSYLLNSHEQYSLGANWQNTAEKKTSLRTTGNTLSGIHSYSIIIESFEDTSKADKIRFEYAGPNDTADGKEWTRDWSLSEFNNINSNAILDVGHFIDQGDGQVVVNGSFKKWTREETPITPPLAPPSTPDVPEPSAFGLLAGIGALALVASRRRR